MNRNSLYGVTIAAGAWVALLVGCDRVAIDQPVGEPVAASMLEQFDGRWRDVSGNVFEIRRLDDSALMAGGLQWKDDRQEFVVINVRLVPRRIGEHLYLFLDANENDSLYDLQRIKFEDPDTIVTYAPNPTAFREAVEKKQIEGTVELHDKERFTVRLDSTGESLRKLLGEATVDKLFSSDDPNRVKRIKAEADAG